MSMLLNTMQDLQVLQDANHSHDGSSPEDSPRGSDSPVPGSPAMAELTLCPTRTPSALFPTSLRVASVSARGGSMEHPANNLYPALPSPGGRMQGGSLNNNNAGLPRWGSPLRPGALPQGGSGLSVRAPGADYYGDSEEETDMADVCPRTASHSYYPPIPAHRRSTGGGRVVPHSPQTPSSPGMNLSLKKSGMSQLPLLDLAVMGTPVKGDRTPQTPMTPSTPVHHKNRTLVITAALIVAVGLAIGLGVGLGVGLGLGLRKDLRDSTSTGTTPGGSPSSTPTGAPTIEIIYSAVGVLPASLSGQLVATSLSLTVLASNSIASNSDAVSLAKQLQASIELNAPAVVGNLFVAWSSSFAQNYTNVNQSADALSAFNSSVMLLVNANVAATEGSWQGLNQFSGYTMGAVQTLLGATMGHATANTTAPFNQTDPSLNSTALNGTSIVTNTTSNATSSGTSTSTAPSPAEATNWGSRRSLLATPTFVNWTATGRTTPVKNQGACACCWANSAMAAVEDAIAIAYPYSTPTSFSRQVMVSCANSNIDSNFDSFGCNEGAADDVMGFMATYTTPLESVYPYTATQSACNMSMLTIPAAANNWMNMIGNGQYAYSWTTKKWGYNNVNYVQTGSEAALMAAVAIQPVAFYWAAGPSWYSYSGGIYTATDCATSVNHGMLIVGFDAVNRYWIVQNSWGTSWGTNGFAKVNMTGTVNGPCLMYTSLFAPIIADLGVMPTPISKAVGPPTPPAPPKSQTGGSLSPPSPAPKPSPPAPKPPAPSPPKAAGR